MPLAWPSRPGRSWSFNWDGSSLLPLSDWRGLLDSWLLTPDPVDVLVYIVTLPWGRLIWFDIHMGVTGRHWLRTESLFLFSLPMGSLLFRLTSVHRLLNIDLRSRSISRPPKVLQHFRLWVLLSFSLAPRWLLFLFKGKECPLFEFLLLIVPVAVDFKGLEHNLLHLELSLVKGKFVHLDVLERLSLLGVIFLWRAIRWSGVTILASGGLWWLYFIPHLVNLVDVLLNIRCFKVLTRCHWYSKLCFALVFHNLLG